MDVVIAVGEIELAQEIAVVRRPCRDRSCHCRAQSSTRLVTPVLTTPVSLLRKSGIAGEHDLPDREFFVFLDLEDEIDPVVLELDGFRHDPRLEIAAQAIKRDDALDVALHEGAPQRAALLGLQILLEIGVLDLVVALEGDADDGRVLDDRSRTRRRRHGRFSRSGTARWRIVCFNVASSAAASSLPPAAG